MEHHSATARALKLGVEGPHVACQFKKWACHLSLNCLYLYVSSIDDMRNTQAVSFI